MHDRQILEHHHGAEESLQKLSDVRPLRCFQGEAELNDQQQHRDAQENILVELYATEILRLLETILIDGVHRVQGRKDLETAGRHTRRWSPLRTRPQSPHATKLL